MVLSETVAYFSLFSLTIIFSVFAFVMKDDFWRVVLKAVAGMFWIFMAVTNIYYMGSDGMLMVISLPYAIFGLLFIVAIYKDFLNEKKDRVWKFPD